MYDKMSDDKVSNTIMSKEKKSNNQIFEFSLTFRCNLFPPNLPRMALQNIFD